MSESVVKNEGIFKGLQEYILDTAVKLPDGTPIFSARRFALMIDEARKEFPVGFVRVKGTDERLIVGSREMYEWFLKWFGEPEK